MRELFAVLFVLAFLYLQTASAESVTLIDDKPTVPAGKAIYYRVYIDITGKEKNIIFGDVIETAGYDINFYVFDQKGFNTWWYEGRLIGAYVAAQRIKSYSYSFVPDHTDYYYFVLDNKYSWFTNKVPQIKAIWTYQTITPILTPIPTVPGIYVTVKTPTVVEGDKAKVNIRAENLASNHVVKWWVEGPYNDAKCRADAECSVAVPTAGSKATLFSTWSGKVDVDVYIPTGILIDKADATYGIFSVKAGVFDQAGNLITSAAASFNLVKIELNVNLPSTIYKGMEFVVRALPLHGEDVLREQ